MIKKLTKLKQVGRFFFLKGLWAIDPNEIIPDSKTPEYYYFVVQHSRVALCNLQTSLTAKNLLLRPWRFGLTLVLFPIKFWQLKIANELAQAYMNELQLLRLSNESR